MKKNIPNMIKGYQIGEYLSYKPISWKGKFVGPPIKICKLPTLQIKIQ